MRSKNMLQKKLQINCDKYAKKKKNNTKMAMLNLKFWTHIQDLAAVSKRAKENGVLVIIVVKSSSSRSKAVTCSDVRKTVSFILSNGLFKV